VFDPHTSYKYYYDTRIAHKSPGIGTSIATEGFLPTPTEEPNLYK